MRQKKVKVDVYDWDRLDMIIRKCETIDKEMGFLLDIMRWTGLRISDVLTLTYKDVMGSELVVVEKKTKKVHKSNIRYRFKERMDYWVSIFNPYNKNELIFKSYDVNGNVQPKHQNSLLRRFKIISKRYNGGCNRVGFHSVRQSFGHKLYSIGKNKNDIIMKLMRIFNHSRPSITLEYIGVSQQEEEELMDSLYIDM